MVPENGGDNFSIRPHGAVTDTEPSTLGVLGVY